MDDCARIRRGASRTAVRFLVVAIVTAAPNTAIGQAADDWVGKRVVQKSNTFALRIESQVVERSRKSIEIYRVEQVNNGWLWLKAEGQGIAGWATVNDVVPVDDAIGFFTNQIRANPGDAFAYQMRAQIWREVKKELDIALGDYNEALRLDPSVTSYNNRGLLWHDKKDYDKAIADYNEAIRLDPNLALAYNNRGNAWSDKKDYDKAIADYNEAIRLDPKYVYAFYNRTIAFWLTGRDANVISGVKDVLGIGGWRGELSTYAAILGDLAARRAGKDDEARKFLDDVKSNGDTTAWPYPIVRYLRGEIDEKELLTASTDDDKRTESHANLGIDLSLKGKPDEATAHFRWVKEHGNPGFTEYTLSLAELERLEKAKGAGAKP